MSPSPRGPSGSGDGVHCSGSSHQPDRLGTRHGGGGRNSVMVARASTSSETCGNIGNNMSPETTEIRGGVEAFWVVDGASAVLNTGKCKGEALAGGSGKGRKEEEKRGGRGRVENGGSAV